jgi:hypothetical protein
MSLQVHMAPANGKNLLTGIAIGVGATLAARDVFPALAPLVRPLAKQGLKAAFIGYERGREAVAEFAEFLSDLSAEVQAELRVERAAEAKPEDGIQNSTHMDGTEPDSTRTRQ